MYENPTPCDQHPEDSAFDAILLVFVLSNFLLLKAGYTLREVGAISGKHTRTIFVHTICVFGAGALAWLLGSQELAAGDHWFAGGAPTNITESVDRHDDVDCNGSTHASTVLILEFFFATIVCSIVSGAVVPRIALVPLIVYSCCLLGVVYPVVVHWLWSSNGWLRSLGYVDDGGVTCISIFGGFAALATITTLQPRPGRFAADPENPKKVVSRNIETGAPMVETLGTLLIIVAWWPCSLGFKIIHGAMEFSHVSRSLVCGMLALGSSICCAVLYSVLRFKSYRLSFILNAALAGMVVSSAVCCNISTWGAVGAGIAATLLYRTSSHVVENVLRLDDPLDSFSIHGACGMFGSLARGAMGGATIQIQVLGVAATVGWVMVISLVLLFILSRVMTYRISQEDQLLGLDTKYNDAYKVRNLDSTDVLLHSMTKKAADMLLKQPDLRQTGDQNSRKVSSLQKISRKAKTFSVRVSGTGTTTRRKYSSLSFKRQVSKRRSDNDGLRSKVVPVSSSQSLDEIQLRSEKGRRIVSNSKLTPLKHKSSGFQE